VSDIFAFVHGRAPNSPDDVVLTQEYSRLLNSPPVFRKSVPELLAFHEWVEHEFPEDSNANDYVFIRFYEGVGKQLRMPKKYFTEGKKTKRIYLKNEIFSSWMEQV